MASTYVLHPLVQLAGMSYNFGVEVRGQRDRELVGGVYRGEVQKYTKDYEIMKERENMK